MNKNDLQKFQKKIELDLLSGCWEWTDHLDKDGYGRLRVGDKRFFIHRLSYEHWNGSISKGLTIDHLCRNRKCANPEHLEAVTIQENLRRGFRPSGKYHYHTQQTECINGHPFNDENTYIRPNGHRDCKICIRLRGRKYRIKMFSLSN